MVGTIDEVVGWFVEQGFQIAYRSTAVSLLIHPDYPGLQVTAGTVYVVVDRDGQEIYRSHFREFVAADAERALQRR